MGFCMVCGKEEECISVSRFSPCLCSACRIEVSKTKCMYCECPEDKFKELDEFVALGDKVFNGETISPIGKTQLHDTEADHNKAMIDNHAVKIECTNCGYISPPDNAGFPCPECKLTLGSYDNPFISHRKIDIAMTDHLNKKFEERAQPAFVKLMAMINIAIIDKALEYDEVIRINSGKYPELFDEFKNWLQVEQHFTVSTLQEKYDVYYVGGQKFCSALQTNQMFLTGGAYKAVLCNKFGEVPFKAIEKNAFFEYLISKPIGAETI